ncbi:uncharacterized protein F5891DRAFT_1200778 [Suillus fuscotomentosus]|uniref:Uncharacterized protein n=1 Tax=Suillus fuscotomentosus TaxID=1912939 RepID=A0AAD4HC21_9AGAM|nr:uncharacterized protein F5891DRAFT_1200778 [Suillus fuscotomentosus]KAG1886421.1 hypothetical protein F5891DRAFT_1200778 [Suillus fuscotomentosus]
MYPGHGQRQPSRAPNDPQNQFNPAIHHGTEPEPYSNQFNPGDSSLSLPNHGLPRRDEFFSAGMGGQQDGPVTQTPAPGSFQRHLQDAPLYPYRAAVTPHARQMGHHSGTPHNNLDTPVDHSSLNSTVARLVSEVQNLKDVTQNLLFSNNELQQSNDSLKARIQVNEEAVEEILKTNSNRKKVGNRNVSNSHAALKPIIHPYFFELCDIDPCLSKSKRIKLLGAVKPLGNGEPHEAVSTKIVWHLNWLGNVDDDVNALYIKEIVNLVWENEKARRENPNAKHEIANEDYDLTIITECVKTYFRNIHKQASDQVNDDKAAKALERKDRLRQRSRRQAITKSRCQAALIYETQSGNKGAVAMIDTDFASDILSYDSEGDLSADTLSRWERAKLAKLAFYVEGSKWRSVDYVAFLRWLSLRNMQKNEEHNEPDTDAADDTTRPPANKHRRTDAQKHRKKVFDLAPAKMNDNKPKSHKKNVPFKSMVSAVWARDHADDTFLDGTEWLTGFYKNIGQGVLIKEDEEYLGELQKWHDEEMDADEMVV